MKGFQGYVASRSIQGNTIPQHVQNIVIRDYCQKRGMPYLLSGTEYAIPGCFLILNQIMGNLGSLDGVVMYSMFQLPEDSSARSRIYSKFLDNGKSLHFAVEGLSLHREDEVTRLDDIWAVTLVMRELPSPGSELA